MPGTRQPNHGKKMSCKDNVPRQTNQHSFLIIECFGETACNLHKGAITLYYSMNKFVYEKQMNYSLGVSASCIEAICVSYSSVNSHFNECFNAMKSELSIAPRWCTKNGDTFRIYSKKKYSCICRWRDSIGFSYRLVRLIFTKILWLTPTQTPASTALNSGSCLQNLIAYQECNEVQVK